MLVGRGGAGPHDLVRMMRQGRIYESAAESQFYAEPKRLERLGYLRARKEPGRTHARTHYELTSKGLDALRAWMGTRPEHPAARQPTRSCACSPPTSSASRACQVRAC